MDAGQPTQQPMQPDSGARSSNAAGAAPPPMGTPTVSKPDMPRECMPGIYEGTFEGPVTFAVGSFNNVSGTLRAELVLDASGDALQVRDGLMTGKDSTGVGMSAGWTGTVNCASKQLENGRHEHGAWENGSTFTGTLEGTYAIAPYVVSGTWKVQSEQIPLAGGNGTWHMNLIGNPAP
jgi:hypothetical protein